MMIAPLSGCLGDASDAAADPSETVDDGPQPGASGDPNETTNTTTQPPVLAVRVEVDGTEVAPENGSYAVLSTVNVTFDASASRDPDGGDITVAWTVDGNATAADAVFVHAFPSPGNFTVDVRVTDDESDSAHETLLVVVGPSGPTWLRVDARTFTDTQAAPVAGYVDECGGAGADIDRTEFAWTFVDVETNGTKSVVNRTLLRLTATGTPTDVYGDGIDLDLVFRNPAGAVVAQSAGESATETIDLYRDLPAGAYKVEVLGCLGLNVTFTIQAEAHYVTRDDVAAPA